MGIISEQAQWQVLGTLLRSLRERAELTLQEAEKKADVSYSYLSQLERGLRKPPSHEILRRIARAYMVEESVLLEAAGYEGKPKSTIAAETIDWAFSAMCADPHYIFGAKVRHKPFDLDTKAFLVEIYCHCSGRNLFKDSEAAAELFDTQFNTEPTQRLSQSLPEVPISTQIAAERIVRAIKPVIRESLQSMLSDMQLQEDIGASSDAPMVKPIAKSISQPVTNANTKRKIRLGKPPIDNSNK